eukprot:CAMPEP_0184478362 /NCGR_PEP_ID=MMETSP0113_2-20130426/414_1 /TAXON_ID=91329 /ORGANISM="Norrisiella sphaerica, Strain BC52" /LENGTH=378 /DNA_ID=CAMNT_0026856127 /DNA_START=534 /DNA_END=1670 /DNA_ORIENTATION=+
MKSSERDLKALNKGLGWNYNKWEQAWIHVTRGSKFRKYMMEKRTFNIWGYEYHVSISEICGHVSFAMLAISYTVGDMLMLRVFAIASIGSMMVFNYWHPVGFTLWLPFRWNALFLATNLLWVGSLHRHNQMSWIKKYDVDLDDIHRHVFPSLQKSDFARLMTSAVYKEYPANTLLSKENEKNGKVYLIVDGQVTVSRKSKSMYKLATCQFVGTLGVHTSLYIDKAISTAMVTSRKLRCLEWKKDDLVREVEGNPRLLAALDAALSINELRKTFDMTVTPANKQDFEAHSKSEAAKMYELVVQSMMGDELYIPGRSKDALRRFRLLYKIPDSTHLKALEKAGWTEKQFEEGYKAPEENPEFLEANDHQPSHAVLGDLHS